MAGLGWQELSIILLIVIVLFGWKKLPEISRSVGRSARIFKSEVDEMKRDPKADRPSEASTSTVQGETVDPDAARKAAEDRAREAERRAADAERAATEARADAEAQRRAYETRLTQATSDEQPPANPAL